MPGDSNGAALPGYWQLSPLQQTCENAAMDHDSDPAATAQISSNKGKGDHKREATTSTSPSHDGRK